MTHRPGRIIGAMLTFSLGLVVPREIYVATVSCASALVKSISAKHLGIAAVCHSEAFTEYLTLYENSLDSLFRRLLRDGKNAARYVECPIATIGTVGTFFQCKIAGGL